MLIINKKVKNMQNIILSVIALENVNDSQKLALIKEICEKLNDSKGIEDKVENALRLCGEFQSNLDNLQDRIDDLESNLNDFEDLQRDFNDLESNFEDLQSDFDNLEVDNRVFEDLESKMSNLEEGSNKLMKLLIKKGIIDEKEITEEEITEEETPNNN